MLTWCKMKIEQITIVITIHSEGEGEFVTISLIMLIIEAFHLPCGGTREKVLDHMADICQKKINS